MSNHHDIPIAQIDFPDPLNGRAALDPARVASLAAQLHDQPLLHPITVRPIDGRYVLIAGRTRVAAYERLGRNTIPATLIDATDLVADTLRLAENVSRSQLSPIEEARQLMHLVETNPGGAEAVADSLGRPLNWILDRLEMLAWPDQLQLYVHTRKITIAAARCLARITPETIRDQRIHDAANHGCSARTARLWQQTAHRDDPNEPAPPIFASQIPVTHYETETRVLCFGCQQLNKLEETHSLRWCNHCIEMLTPPKQPYHEQSPTCTPPIYDPPTKDQERQDLNALRNGSPP